MLRLSAARVLRWVGIVAWVVSALAWVARLVGQQFIPQPTWLYDWHVYSAAASSLVERTLYYAPLESAFPLPVTVFNYPPLSALAVVPLLLLPDQVAGTMFVTANIAAMAAAAILAARLMRLSEAAAWAGLGFYVFTFNPWAWLALLGNNTPLVLLLVVAFGHFHLERRQGLAGVLLGIAIGLKLWPAALLPLLIREGQWRSLLWAAGIGVAVGLATVAWLGPDVIGPAADALRSRGVIKPENPVFGITWLRENLDWWPWWGGYAIAAALALIPARGRLGLGLGILAGMAAIPNLWRHYLPTALIGFLLVAFGLKELRRAESKRLDSPQLAKAEGRRS